MTIDYDPTREMALRKLIDEGGVTIGDWRVFTRQHPHHLGGVHVEHTVGTDWIHPQLQGHMPIFGISRGIPEKEGGEAIHFVATGKADADFIAMCNPHTVRMLLDEINRLRIRSRVYAARSRV